MTNDPSSLFGQNGTHGRQWWAHKTCANIHNYKRAKASDCFIATATYGSDSNEVAILQAFRDQRLRNYKAGRNFITMYERLSPQLADIIKSHSFLRLIVRWGMVAPITWVVRKVMRLQHYKQS